MLIKVKKTIAEVTCLNSEGEVERFNAEVPGHYKGLTPRVINKIKKHVSDGDSTCVFVHSISPIVRVYEMADEVIEIHGKLVELNDQPTDE